MREVSELNQRPKSDTLISVTKIEFFLQYRQRLNSRILHNALYILLKLSVGMMKTIYMYDSNIITYFFIKKCFAYAYQYLDSTDSIRPIMDTGLINIYKVGKNEQ